MELDDYIPALEEELGEITSLRELIPGVYDVECVGDGCFLQEYYAVTDAAPIAAKLRNYGKKIDGLRLIAWDDVKSGCQVVHYEVAKYSITVNNKPVSEWEFRDMALHAMELHPEYFGMFPVPFHTPCGYTLLHRTLANGVYWLETSKCRELLAVCFPVWNAELSQAAVMPCKMTRQDLKAGAEQSTCYLFYSKEASCVPIYELMETRREWDGTVIDRPALMNAIWKFMPEYALRLNGQKEPKGSHAAPGVEPFPAPERDRLICMYPDAGTDFLLLP